METDKLEQTAVNDSGTAVDSDTRLTQRRSRRVRGRLLMKQLVKMAKGQVYFVRAGDAIKIGFSINSAGRIAGLQTSNHESLELLGTMPGTERDEQRLHAMFQHLRLRGEWFTAGPDLLRYIETETEQGRAAAKARAAEERAARRQSKRKASPAVRNLIALRASVGADTLKGHVCSDLVEEIENWQIAKATGNALQLANLAKLMPPRMAIISDTRTAA